MKVLFIGGTGVISTAVTTLAVERGLELYHLNRGQRPAPEGVQTIVADIRNPAEARQAVAHREFDVVVNWIAFTPRDIELDLGLFRDRTKQYIFISSASAYQKPLSHPVITESTPLHNPYWLYSRNKIACEQMLLKAYNDGALPVTIVRPSYTYDHNFPIALGSGSTYTLIDRLKTGRPIIIHGDGTSLWVNTHSEDFARGFVGLLGHSQAIGHAFHITSDEVLTWNQIYGTIADAVGVQPNVVHIPSDFIAQVAPAEGDGLLGDKAHSVIFDNSKIKTFVPGFQCHIPFREGVRRTLDWFHADPARQRIDAAVNAEMDRILAAYGAKTA
jgi:nucleoside-diphosphate-sugar epimerase